MEIKFVNITSRIKNKGGPSGGKTLSGRVPEFDWEQFKNVPNAEEFVRKAYFAAAKKIIREIDEKKNGSVRTDLDSMETVIARVLSFTQDDIRGWLKTRDWSRVKEVSDISKYLVILEKRLPRLASRQNEFTIEQSTKIANKIIAAVADDADPIADYLFTILTTQRASDEDLMPL